MTARASLWATALLAIFSTGCDTAESDTGRPDYCPDPADECVHYVSDDPDECDTLDFSCDEDQTGFGGVCGCGCLDDC